MTLLSVLAIGFVLGLRHATEADHVTAVATLAAQHGSVSQIVRQGVAWGVGHSLMLLLIGSVVLSLGHAVPEWLAQALECAVGVVLVVLGIDVLRRLIVDPAAGPLPAHMTSVHDHRRSGPPVRALVVGMVHGMAGSAALIVLSLGAMQSVGRALLYIVTFGVGSIAGMALLSIVMAGPLHFSARWLGKGHRAVMGLIGVTSCALGAVVVYQSGIAGALSHR